MKKKHLLSFRREMKIWVIMTCLLLQWNRRNLKWTVKIRNKKYAKTVLSKHHYNLKIASLKHISADSSIIKAMKLKQWEDDSFITTLSNFINLTMTFWKACEVIWVVSLSLFSFLGLLLYSRSKYVMNSEI